MDIYSQGLCFCLLFQGRSRISVLQDCQAIGLHSIRDFCTNTAVRRGLEKDRGQLVTVSFKLSVLHSTELSFLKFLELHVPYAGVYCVLRVRTQANLDARSPCTSRQSSRIKRAFGKVPNTEIHLYVIKTFFSFSFRLCKVPTCRCISYFKKHNLA